MIDLLIVTGYLGSGKTTLLKGLTSVVPQEKCRFIVNEAGRVALDQASYELIEDRTTVVAGGCACCVRKDALIDSLTAIVDAQSRRAAANRVRYLVVETSGLANPAPIIFSIKSDPYLRHHVAVAGLICVLGSVEAGDALTRYEEVAQQLAMADVVVLSKTDLVDEPRLRSLERAVARTAIGCPLFLARQGAADWAAMLTALANRRRPGADLRAAGAAANGRGRATPSAAHRHAGVASCVLRFDDALDWVAFGVWLSALLATYGESVVRVKGVIKVSAWDGQRFFVLVNGVQHVVYPPQHVESSSLPDRPALVFILKNIEPERLVRSLRYSQHVHAGNRAVRVWREY